MTDHCAHQSKSSIEIHMPEEEHINPQDVSISNGISNNENHHINTESPHKSNNEKIQQLTAHVSELETKLEDAIRQKDLAVKEKEAMVVRYAISEKNLLDNKHQKDQWEKKHKDQMRENEIMQHKIQTMSSEKARICQLLDNKCYEYKTSQQEVERLKADLNAIEVKLKWSQNNLKTEIELHKECQHKNEQLHKKLREATEQIEAVKTETQETMKDFYSSQDTRAHDSEQQTKEQQATLILLKHERDDKEQQLKTLKGQLERLQTKQEDILRENNELSLKVQQLERGRLDSEQKLSELRATADQQRQDSALLQAKNAQCDQLQLQLKNEQDQLQACIEQINLLKQRNCELEFDMAVCREREAELLLFTQQLTDKNVRLQSEFTALETRIQQLTCEQNLLKRSVKEHETKSELLSSQSLEQQAKYTSENGALKKALAEKSAICDSLKTELADQRGEYSLLKRKYELSLKEVNKELQQYHKKLESLQSSDTRSSSSSNSSLSVVDRSNNSPPTEQIKVIQPDQDLDRQTLLQHIVKLQRASARKSEKLDFLEEHVNTLVAELQKKTHLLQNYILRDQSGTLSSNTMDNNKANIAKLSGIMASMYSSRVADNNLTLELSLDINRKLQAVLEDALLKNITLKENVDTLGQEIERLTQLLQSYKCLK